MSVEERIIKLEEFAADVRQFTQVLTEIMKRHDERLDEHTEMFREANHSIAALADAQIRTEDSLKKLIERLDRDGS
jgi:replicative DNA helicase